jgi:hypothetical protein
LPACPLLTHQILDVDLNPFVGMPAKAGAGPLTNGHQSMLICAVYAVGGGGVDWLGM